jgi:hypothetical protein
LYLGFYFGVSSKLWLEEPLSILLSIFFSQGVIPQNSFRNGAPSKEIENRMKMNKNTGLRARVVFSGGRRRQWAGGISEGAPVGPTSSLGAPRGWAHPVSLGLTGAPPLGCVQGQKFLNVVEKIILNFLVILRTFIFGTFFIARIIQKTG